MNILQAWQAIFSTQVKQKGYADDERKWEKEAQRCN